MHPLGFHKVACAIGPSEPQVHEPTTSIAVLPTEVLCIIFAFLDNCWAVRGACRRWFHITAEHHFKLPPSPVHISFRATPQPQESNKVSVVMDTPLGHSGIHPFRVLAMAVGVLSILVVTSCGAVILFSRSFVYITTVMRITVSEFVVAKFNNHYFLSYAMAVYKIDETGIIIKALSTSRNIKSINVKGCNLYTISACGYITVWEYNSGRCVDTVTLSSHSGVDIVLSGPNIYAVSPLRCITWLYNIKDVPTIFTPVKVTTNYCCAPYLLNGICIATSKGLFASPSTVKHAPSKVNKNVYYALAVYYDIIIAATRNTVHFIVDKIIVHSYETELYITGIFLGPASLYIIGNHPEHYIEFLPLARFSPISPSKAIL
jgi:hypothetical protein